MADPEHGSTEAATTAHTRAALPDWVFGVALLAGGALILFEVSGYRTRVGGGYGSGFFPSIIAVGMLLIGTILTGRGVANRVASSDNRGRVPARDRSDTSAVRTYAGAILLVALTGFAAFALEPLGFLPTAFVVTATFMLERRGRPLSTIAYAAGAVLLVYLFFTEVFDVLLPPGIVPSGWL